MPYEGLAKFVDHKPRWTGELSFVEDALVKPLHWTKPRKVFVNSMSDLFHENVKNEWLDRAFAVMALTPQHTYQILTKRPERMRDYFNKIGNFDTLEYCDRWDAARKWLRKVLLDKGERASMGRPEFVGTMMGHQKWPLPNVWLGVSVEDQKTADERIPLLLDTPAAVRFLSVEPLLGPVDLQNHFGICDDCDALIDEHRYKGEFFSVYHYPPHIHWVIAGGESGPKARPMNPEWVRSIRDQCVDAGVKFFFKQNGEFLDIDTAISLGLTNSYDGKYQPYTRIEGYSLPFVKVGKKAAGRELDGRTWDQMPNTQRFDVLKEGE